eukprot:1019655-Pyramimonas_sp.AAC.1
MAAAALATWRLTSTSPSWRSGGPSSSLVSQRLKAHQRLRRLACERARTPAAAPSRRAISRW